MSGSEPASAESRARLPIALTMGEPAGIGGEIALMAWSGRGRGAPLPPFFVIDDPARQTKLAAARGIEAPVQPIDRPAQARAARLPGHR